MIVHSAQYTCSFAKTGRTFPDTTLHNCKKGLAVPEMKIKSSEDVLGTRLGKFAVTPGVTLLLGRRGVSGDYMRCN